MTHYMQSEMGRGMQGSDCEFVHSLSIFPHSNKCATKAFVQYVLALVSTDAAFEDASVSLEVSSFARIERACSPRRRPGRARGRSQRFRVTSDSKLAEVISDGQGVAKLNLHFDGFMHLPQRRIVAIRVWKTDGTFEASRMPITLDHRSFWSVCVDFMHMHSKRGGS